MSLPSPTAFLCLVFASVSLACVSEVDQGDVIQLPLGIDRFIEEPTEFIADEVLIETVYQYRAEMVPYSDESLHSKEVSPDRIRLKSLDPRSFRPVSLTFRNMTVKARSQIEVRFSDRPLVENGADATVIVMIGIGLANMEGPGYDLTADRIVIRNDQVKAFGEGGKAWPLPPALR